MAYREPRNIDRRTPTLSLRIDAQTFASLTADPNWRSTVRRLLTDEVAQPAWKRALKRGMKSLFAK